MTIIGLVGFIGSGKDTVANKLLEKRTGIQESFASPLKDMTAAIFGWPRHLLEGDTIESRDFRETPDIFWTRKTGIDNFTPRLALQLLGTEVMRNHFHENIWLNSLEYRLRQNASPEQLVVISDCRYVNELEVIRQMGGKIAWVVRGEEPEWYETAKDANNGNAVSRKIMQTRYRDVHTSEWAWAGFRFDSVINNNGDLGQLDKAIDNFLERNINVELKAI